MRQPLCLVGLAVLVSPLVGACSDGDACEGDCVCEGADCICPDSGDCVVHCGDDCHLQCTGSGDCDFTCDVACDVECPGSGLCLVDVLAGSTISCTGSGDCDVICHGDCSLACPGSATCTVTCLDGGVCDFASCSGEVVDCDGVTAVCNGDCP